MPRIAADTLQNFIADIFVAAGCSKEESGRIGKYLVGSNLAGHDSHGVARAPRYVKWKQDGVFFADKTVKRVVDTPVLAILDGQYGFGQTTAPQAVALGIEKCKAMGIVGDRAEEFRSCRPRRRMGGDGGGGRPRLDPFRQCAWQRAGGAVRRRRPHLLHRALLRGHSAQGRQAGDP